MFEALKKLMAAAEELGTVSEIKVDNWIDPGKYRVEFEGKDSSGMTFEMRVILQFPVPVTDKEDAE